MSSRPVSNLGRILASINFKDDDIVVTPEPVVSTDHPLRGIGSRTSNSAKMEVSEETPTQSSFTSRANSPISDEDVPLTMELLTPKVRMNSIPGFGRLGLESTKKRTSVFHSKTRRDDDDKRHLGKRQQQFDCARTPSKKNVLPFKLPASSESLLEYGGTSDGLDAYQQRERDGRQIVRLKKKTKKRQGNEFKNGKERGDTHDAN